MYNVKRVLRDTVNIKHFLQTYGVGQGGCAFLTITFSKKVLIKKEASRLLNIWLTQMHKKFSFHYVCVTELQKNGSYHFHLILKPLNFTSLKVFRNYFKSLPFIGFIQVKWTQGNASDVCNYLTKYMLKGKLRSGERIVSYSKGVSRIFSSSFSFVNSAWRKRWNMISSAFGVDRIKKVYGSLDNIGRLVFMEDCFLPCVPHAPIVLKAEKFIFENFRFELNKRFGFNLKGC